MTSQLSESEKRLMDKVMKQRQGELGKAKAQAGIWGASAAASPKPAGMGAPLGGFSGSTSGGAASSGGDDLLL